MKNKKSKSIIERLNYLTKKFGGVKQGIRITEIYSYNKMPTIVPLNSQIDFYDDGFEAIVDEKEIGDSKWYICMVVDEARKKIVKYRFEVKKDKEHGFDFPA